MKVIFSVKGGRAWTAALSQDLPTVHDVKHHSPGPIFEARFQHTTKWVQAPLKHQTTTSFQRGFVDIFPKRQNCLLSLLLCHSCCGDLQFSQLGHIGGLIHDVTPGCISRFAMDDHHGGQGLRQTSFYLKKKKNSRTRECT